MANTIRIKKSTGSSNPGSMANAEVAFREGDEVLIYGTGTGGAGGSATSIIPIGGKGAFFDKATNRAGGTVDISLTDTQTATFTPSILFYDVLLTEPSGDKFYYLEGKLFINEGYTA